MSEKNYKWSKRISLSFLCSFVLALLINAGLEPTVTAQQAGWQVTLEEGKTTGSTLTINNRCKAPHKFRVKNKIKYLRFQESTESMLIAPGAGKPLGVTFDSTGLKLKVYRDELIVECLDCKKEKTCTQDRDKVPVQLTVTKPLVTDTGTGLLSTNQDIRTKIAGQLTAEARKFKLELNINGLSVSSLDDTLLAFVPVLKNEIPLETDLRKGADVGFLFINSTKTLPVPNGYYKIRISENTQAKYTASFLDSRGRSVAQLPVTSTIGNNNATSNRPRVGLCMPSLRTCFVFPWGTSNHDITNFLEFGWNPE